MRSRRKQKIRERIKTKKGKKLEKPRFLTEPELLKRFIFLEGRLFEGRK